VLCVATLAVSKVGEQGIVEDFSSQLAVVHLTCGSPDMLTSLDFADKPAEHDQLFPHLYLIDLNSFPYRYILCSQIFRTTF
jgi:hypothetical protein